MDGPSPQHRSVLPRIICSHCFLLRFAVLPLWGNCNLGAISRIGGSFVSSFLFVEIAIIFVTHYAFCSTAHPTTSRHLFPNFSPRWLSLGRIRDLGCTSYKLAVKGHGIVGNIIA
ncbi:hypothetical protein HOY80DRAFT_369328 [Tuber brumale]|nr:hypothetical protein HOY80DRAFT_369328 [Tuber brumale]